MVLIIFYYIAVSYITLEAPLKKYLFKNNETLHFKIEEILLSYTLLNLNILKEILGSLNMWQ